MKKLYKKGVELALSKVIWFVILGVFFIVMVVWYLSLRGKINFTLASLFA